MNSEKQKIYLNILYWVQPTLRNGLSLFARVRPLRLFWRRDQLYLRQHYELAQLCHQFTLCLSTKEFNHSDLWFLNHHARSFLTDPENVGCVHYSLIALYVQKLFQLVPDEMRSQLEWAGPEGDYSHAAPRRGDEIARELSQERQIGV